MESDGQLQELQRRLSEKSLLEATEKGSLGEVVRLVETERVSVNCRAPNLAIWAPLHYAAFCGHSAIVEYLVEQGADVNCTTENGWTPLHLSVFKGHVSVVDHLLRQEASQSVKDNLGRTPVDMISFYCGYQENRAELIRLFEAFDVSYVMK